MNQLLFVIFSVLSALFLYLFIKGRYSLSPLWLMLSAWALAIGIPRLNLSELEQPWSGKFWILLLLSLISFAAGFFIFNKLWGKLKVWERFRLLDRREISALSLRIVIYALFAASLAGLFLFYSQAGNFPLLAEDTDVFRFEADEQVPGLINYTAQLARLFIPLSFFLIFWQGFSFRRHFDLILVSIAGALAITLFASRTQIFFVDLWIMALFLLMKRPNLKQALKFYPAFIIVSVVVLAAVPLIRQYKSYGTTDYLANVTVINTENFNPAAKFFVPIYVGISFNMQSLLHAQQYYEANEIQMGKVTLDPFTNILGLGQFKPDFDLGEIFYSWWNTGTYLFPFVQDFGNLAFLLAPFLAAGILTLLWRFWLERKNFLSINLYAYACFFMAMTIYLSFTVRAEMYMDLFLIALIYYLVTKTNILQNEAIKSN
jgi:oligosaccharide repeat unit polymerase